jgi:hypothetical protein
LAENESRPLCSDESTIEKQARKIEGVAGQQVPADAPDVRA